MDIPSALVNLWHGLGNLIWPASCLHCRSPLEVNEKLLCRDCQSYLDLITPKERCILCFAPDIPLGNPHCRECSKKPPVCHRQAAAFEFYGPVRTLIYAFKFRRREDLADLLAAYLTAQFVQLDWDLPDAILPVPMSLERRWARGYNQSDLLARSFGKMVGVPVKNTLRRAMGSPRQTYLPQEMRRDLSKNIFFLRRPRQIEDKSILLIDDVQTTGSTLNRCAEVLYASGVREVRSLVVGHQTGGM